MSLEPHPGETCELCKRRVPHPKKPSSPSQTAVVSIGRAPTDFKHELEARIEALGESAGLGETKFFKARTLQLMLTVAEAVSPDTLRAVAEGMSWGTAKGDE